jgi:hypothetical protein
MFFVTKKRQEVKQSKQIQEIQANRFTIADL